MRRGGALGKDRFEGKSRGFRWRAPHAAGLSRYGAVSEVRGTAVESAWSAAVDAHGAPEHGAKNGCVASGR